MQGVVEWEMYNHVEDSVQAQHQDLGARRASNGAKAANYATCSRPR